MRVSAEPVETANLPPPAQTKVDFVHDVQPILSHHCYACHGPEKQESDLRWDLKTDALKGGKSGPAILPGHSAESRMIQLVAGLEKNLNHAAFGAVTGEDGRAGLAAFQRVSF